MLRTALAFAALALLAAPAAAQQRLTPERVFADPEISGPTPKGVALSPDGSLVTYLRAKEENRDVLDLWAADVKGGQPVRLIDSNALSEAGKELSEAEKARRERQRIAQTGIVEYHWDEQGRTILVPVQGDLWLFERAGGQVRRLTETPGDEIDSKVSPQGRFVSYVRDQNLYVRPLAGGAERALTTEGKDTLSWGVAEFIAQEELNRFTGYWWSPDETRIALTRVDESGVDVIPRFEITGQGATMVEQRYPRAGRPNAVVELYVQDLASGRRTKVDLGPTNDIYLARVDWSKDGRTLYVQRLSRDQKRLDVLAADPATGASRVIATDTEAGWVDVGDDLKPLKDGTFLRTSERTGWKHVYLHGADGRLIRQVTSGDWPVDAILAVDEAKKLVFFAASKDSPLERRIYAVSYAKPAAPRALTAADGWGTAEFAKNGTAFVQTWADPSTPPRTSLNTADGRFVRWIEENRVDAAHPWFPYSRTYAAPDYGTLKASDGQTLHFMTLKPRGFDPAKRYPVVVHVYGGPASQYVRKAWINPTYRLWQEAGYVVFVMDNRGTPNRSVAFERALDRKFGVVDVEDQLAGARWLSSQAWIDPARIGVYGWSNGGFMTLMMLTAENSPYAAGMAGASPTEWSLYDTAYTERYMGQPQETAAAYAASDILNRIDRIKPGTLMLMHGMADDNVLLQNTTRVMEALQAKSVPFELMLFPGQRHGVRGKAKQLFQWRVWSDFFDRKLRPEAAP